MSSFKMTFSLASLILLLGLVFAPVSVMAHPVTTDNNTGEGIHAGDAVGLSHDHPEVTVKIADADPNTDGIQIVDKNEDTEANDLNATIEFDVVITVPIGSEESGDDVEGADIDPTATAYDTNKLQVGTGNDGAVARGTVDPTTTATDREYTVPFTLTIAGKAISDTITGEAAIAAARTASRKKAIADAIADGLMIDIIVPDDMIQTTALVSGLKKGQSNLESKKTVTVIAETVDKLPPPVTFKVDGIPSLTVPFTVTFTSTKMDDEGNPVGATLTAGTNGDIMVTNGYAVEPSLNASSSPSDAPNTVWTVIVQPYPGATDITVTIRDDDSTAPAADATKGSLTLSAPKGTLNSITAATGANDQKPFW